MFHQFAIPDEQKTYLRFFWFEDNNPKRPIIEWWSKVHLIGLKSSPAIANTGIRFAVRENPPYNGDQWIKEDDLLDPIHYAASRKQDPMEKLLAEGFYVDDLLASQPTEEDALRLIETAISRLQRYDLNLCKVQSNAKLVRKAYPPKEALPEVLNFIENDPVNNTTSLGLQWHIAHDTFSIKVGCKDAPFTKRGLLKQMMSVYDPQGMAEPATLTNKLFYRQLTPRKEEDPHCTHALGLDDPIPHQFQKAMGSNASHITRSGILEDPTLILP